MDKKPNRKTDNYTAILAQIEERIFRGESSQVPPELLAQLSDEEQLELQTDLAIIARLVDRSPSPQDEVDESQPPGSVDETLDDVVPVERPLPEIPRYKILNEIGGQMGAVYRAFDRKLKRKVALKIIRNGEFATATDRQRFAREIKALTLLEHRYILRIYDVGQYNRLPYFTSEFVTGGNLEEYLQKHKKPVSLKKKVMMIYCLARALRRAHEAEVIHRDLKPANILIEGKHPKIADFGLAVFTNSKESCTEPNSVIGTPDYMSPEQASGLALDARTDIFSLGSIFYRLLVGRPPFEQGNPRTTLLSVIQDEVIRPSAICGDIPPEVDAICMRCLEKPRDRRYQNANELVDDLHCYLEQKPIRARLKTIVPHSSAKQIQSDLLLARAEQIATQLDNFLRPIQTYSTAMADIMESRPDWSEHELETWIRGNVQKHKRIFGSCVAFEPFQFQREVTDFAMYIHRASTSPMKLKRSDFSTDLSSHYRSQPWYSKSRRSTRGGWTLGGETRNDRRIRFSKPFCRDKQFAGVVSLDLSMKPFRIVNKWLADLKMSEGAYAIAVTETGAVIGQDDANIHVLHAMGKSIVAQESKIGSLGAEPLSGKPAIFAKTLIPTTEWNLVLVQSLDGKNGR